MVSDSSKVTVVVLIATLFVCLFTIPSVIYLIVMPSVMAVIIMIVSAIFSGAIAYYASERIKEIDGGMDDDVDNY